MTAKVTEANSGETKSGRPSGRDEPVSQKPGGNGSLIPRWLPWAASVVAAAGIGDSIYLTLAHYSASVHLACSATGTIDCAKVTTSPQSVIVGVPVAVLGLGFFTAMLVANLPVSWRAPSRLLVLGRLALAVSGIGFALYLVSAELLIINAICLWCTAAHLLAFALFLLVAAGTARLGIAWSKPASPRSRVRAGARH